MTLSLRLRAWWQRRDRRERTMLTLMLAMLAAFVYWYAMLWPLRIARSAAQANYDAAVATFSAIESDAAYIRAHQPANPLRTRDAIVQQVMETAHTTSIAFSRHRSDAQGDFVIEIDRIAAPALFAWLDALVQDHGIAPSRLRITNSAGDLRIEAAFATPSP